MLLGLASSLCSPPVLALRVADCVRQRLTMSTRSDEYPVTAVYLPRKIFRIKEACSNKTALPDTSQAGLQDH